ncbi:MAG: META domain-containing protein [Alsobacter sp.]
MRAARATTALAALLLGGGMAGSALASSPDALRASGNEPGWVLTLTQETLTVSLADGRRISLPAPVPDRLDDRTLRYAGEAEGKPIFVQVVDRLCRDTMTGMPHPKTVFLTLAGRPYEGCGGDPASLLAGRDWTLASLAGTPVASDGRPASLAFTADGQVSGSSGCNRFTGRFTLTGETLSFGPLAATRMACPEPLMQQESRLFAILAAVRGFQIAESGDLVLLTVDGPQLVARPEH